MRVYVAQIDAHDARGVLHVQNVIIEAEDIVQALAQAERWAIVYRAGCPLFPPTVRSVEYDPEFEALFRQTHPAQQAVSDAS